MMTWTHSATIWISCVCLSFYLTIRIYNSRRIPAGLRQVPGPQGFPLIGSALRLSSRPQIELKEWARQYGEIFRVQLGWENWVFVNSPEAVKDIFDKQSAITSSRVPLPVASDLISDGKRFVFMRYNPKWRKLRAIAQRLLTQKMSNISKPSQEYEAKQMVFDLLTDNKNGHEFYMHSRRYTTSAVMTTTYGKRVPDWDCNDVREIYGILKELSENTVAGAWIADLIPPLAKIPLWMQWWRTKALALQQHQTRTWMRYWGSLKEKVLRECAPKCFAKEILEVDCKTQAMSEIQGAFVCGTMLEAGSESTSSILNSLLGYLAASPTAQACAHEELSAVVGDLHSPCFSDESSLPYIRACVKEVLRLRPSANIGVPHYTDADVIYKDYFIPKGTVISINQYFLHLDPSRYEDPEDFRPERYLNHPLGAAAYAAHPDPYQRDHFAFGAGRRACPAMYYVENSLFIVIAKILWAFAIRPPLDGDGKEIPVDVSDAAYEEGRVTIPKRFRLLFLPRSPQIEKAIIQEWETAREEGFYLGGVKVGADGVDV